MSVFVAMFVFKEMVLLCFWAGTNLGSGVFPSLLLCSCLVLVETTDVPTTWLIIYFDAKIVSGVPVIIWPFQLTLVCWYLLILWVLLAFWCRRVPRSSCTFFVLAVCQSFLQGALLGQLIFSSSSK